jgi:hypothetical protein
MRTIVYIEFDDDDRMTVRDLGSGLVVIMPPDPGVLAQLHSARAGYFEAFLDDGFFSFGDRVPAPD